VGLGKKKYLAEEHPDLLELMQGIKNLLDPQHILNPKKIF
jgi:D-lactate dehydrogenase (cytochrome)